MDLAYLSTLQSFAMDVIDRFRSLIMGNPFASGILGTLAAVYLAYSFHSWYRLSHVPGPFWAAFSKYWMVRQAMKGRQPHAFKEATSKYGTYVRINRAALQSADNGNRVIDASWTKSPRHRRPRDPSQDDGCSVALHA